LTAIVNETVVLDIFSGLVENVEKENVEKKTQQENVEKENIE